MLVLNNITKVRNRKRSEEILLDDLSLSFGDNGLVLLDGKEDVDSLFDILSGFTIPDKGEILFGGNIVYDKETNKLDSYLSNKVAFLKKSENLSKNLTLSQNIRVVFSEREYDEVISLLKRFHLLEMLEEKASCLSEEEEELIALIFARVRKVSILLVSSFEFNADFLSLLEEVSKECLVICKNCDYPNPNRRISLLKGKVKEDVVLSFPDSESIKEGRKERFAFRRLKTGMRLLRMKKSNWLSLSCLSLFPLLFVGLFGQIQCFNREKSIVSSLLSSEKEFVRMRSYSLSKDLKFSDTNFSDGNLGYSSFSLDDIRKLKEDIGKNVYGSPIGQSFSYELPPSLRNAFDDAVIPISENNGLELSHGSRLPSEENEVLISSWCFEKMKETGFKDSLSNECFFADDCNLSTVIGSHISFGNQRYNRPFLVCGVYQSNSSKENSFYVSDSFFKSYEANEGVYSVDDLSVSGDQFSAVGYSDQNPDISFSDDGVVLSHSLASSFFEEKAKEKGKELPRLSFHLEDSERVESQHSYLMDFTIPFSSNLADEIENALAPISLYHFAKNNLDDVIKNHSDILSSLKEDGVSLSEYVKRYQSSTGEEKKKAMDVLSIEIGSLLEKHYFRIETIPFPYYEKEASDCVLNYVNKYVAKGQKQIEEIYPELYKEYQVENVSLKQLDNEISYPFKGVDLVLGDICYFSSVDDVKRMVSSYYDFAFVKNDRDTKDLEKLAKLHCQYKYALESRKKNKKGNYILIQEECVNDTQSAMRVFYFIDISMIIVLPLSLFFLGMVYYFFIGNFLENREKEFSFLLNNGFTKREVFHSCLFSFGIFLLTSLLFSFGLNSIVGVILNASLSSFFHNPVFLFIPSFLFFLILSGLILITAFLFSFFSLFFFYKKKLVR